jgi:hypothetical protein
VALVTTGDGFTQRLNSTDTVVAQVLALDNLNIAPLDLLLPNDIQFSVPTSKYSPERQFPNNVPADWESRRSCLHKPILDDQYNIILVLSGKPVVYQCSLSWGRVLASRNMPPLLQSCSDTHDSQVSSLSSVQGSPGLLIGITKSGYVFLW